jgi:molybdopterin-guanine dinucleotide biosynthesis protein
MEEDDANSSSLRNDCDDFYDDFVLVEGHSKDEDAELPRIPMERDNGDPDLVVVDLSVGDGSMNLDEEEADFPVDVDTSDKASIENVPNNNGVGDVAVPLVSSTAFDLTALAK